MSFSQPHLLAVFVLSINASAQVVCALGTGASEYKSSADQRPSQDAMQLAGRVNAAVKSVCGANCPELSVYRNPTAANLMLIAGNGQAKLVYSPQFFGMVSEKYGDAGVVALMAHELGHALDDSLGAAWVKSSWTPELRADAWTACVLAKSNLSASDFESALGALAKYPSQLTPVQARPGWNVRAPVLRTGYTQCGGSGARFDAAHPK